MQACKSESFRFQRNSSRNSSGSSTRSNGQENCRKRLKDKFDEFDKNMSPEKDDSKNVSERSVLSVLHLNDTRKYIRSGAERITKTFNAVRVTFGTISQRFKTATKRRQILEEGPMTPSAQDQTPYSRQILGRTPTKLYSPFGIDSPYNNSTIVKKETLPVSMDLVKP